MKLSDLKKGTIYRCADGQTRKYVGPAPDGTARYRTPGQHTTGRCAPDAFAGAKPLEGPAGLQLAGGGGGGGPSGAAKRSDADRVLEVAQDVHFEAFPSWSIDELLLHPRSAIELCDAVRGKLNRDRRQLPDDQVLRALLGARKHSKLQERPRKRSA